MSTEMRDEIAAEMRSIITGTEELLRATIDSPCDVVAAARARAQETLRVAKQKLADLQDPALERTRDLARSTDQYVREHPWGAVGVAATAGLLLGLAISRRGD
jgi:ElaB/YqjD/DUF883 family membrane-anchored ribosome-binding protein